MQPFLTLQYLYGLARARRPEAEALLESVREYAERAPAFTRTVWREVALPGCEGLYAYARGDFERAWHHLSVAVPRMAEAGGSHAQRDLFEQILLDAALRQRPVGRGAADVGTAAQRGSRWRAGEYALAAVYAQLGLPPWPIRRAAARR